MPTAVRTYVTAGVALVGAGVISATPVATPQALRTASYDAALVASTKTTANSVSAVPDRSTASPNAIPFASTTGSTNVFNIPANVLIALANSPYNFFTALGPGNVALGSEPDGGPSFQPSFNGVTLTQPDGNVVGLGANLNYGGSWWVYSPTNILGTDGADVPRYQALANVLAPFPALSVPLGNMLAAIAASQLPMDAGCTGTGKGACDNPPGILSKMFDIRNAAALFSPSGYTFPTSREGVTCSAEGQCYVKDEDGREVPWSGQTVKLDPSAPFTNFYNSLTETPDFSSIKPVTPDVVSGSLGSFGSGLNPAYNPFVLGTQCGLCAPLVPNPDNAPVPGPVFEDPDAQTQTQTQTRTADVAVEVEESEELTAQAPSGSAGTTAAAAATGPKHRKPTTTGEAFKNVRDSLNSTISKVTDSFKKPTTTSDDTSGTSSASTPSRPSSASASGSAGSDD